MRGLWDNEQPLSPSLLRSALALIGGFLGATALIVLTIGVGNVFAGNYFAAALQFTAGIALPFALWMGLKMMADMLIVLNRAHDRLAALEEASVKLPEVQIEPIEPADTSPIANGPASGPAADDGPTYPSED
jgi:hypothetical protein